VVSDNARWTTNLFFIKFLKGKRLGFERDERGKITIHAVAREPGESLDRACSFCGKKESQVARLIAGAMMYICNECVMLCVNILNEDGSV
jgi:hypothetical protein